MIFFIFEVFLFSNKINKTMVEGFLSPERNIPSCPFCKQILNEENIETHLEAGCSTVVLVLEKLNNFMISMITNYTKNFLMAYYMKRKNSKESLTYYNMAILTKEYISGLTRILKSYLDRGELGFFIYLLKALNENNENVRNIIKNKLNEKAHEKLYQVISILYSCFFSDIICQKHEEHRFSLYMDSLGRFLLKTKTNKIYEINIYCPLCTFNFIYSPELIEIFEMEIQDIERELKIKKIDLENLEKINPSSFLDKLNDEYVSVTSIDGRSKSVAIKDLISDEKFDLKRFLELNINFPSIRSPLASQEHFAIGIYYLIFNVKSMTYRDFNTLRRILTGKMLTLERKIIEFFIFSTIECSNCHTSYIFLLFDSFFPIKRYICMLYWNKNNGKVELEIRELHEIGEDVYKSFIVSCKCRICNADLAFKF